LAKNDDTRRRIEDRDIRRSLACKSSSELARFLLQGVKSDKTFRRKVLAWLIQADAEALPQEAVLGEIGTWIDEVFKQTGRMPRTPNLRALNPVKSAVKGHPNLAVPISLEIVGQVAEFLDAYGGGPASFYNTLRHHFREAAVHLPAMTDAVQRETHLRRMMEFSRKCSDFGYGLDRETAKILSDLRTRLAGRDAAFGESPPR
jgi:hypothetical protein